MKWIMYITVILSVLPAFAHRHPQLNDEQRQCLFGILGEPGQGERPSRDAMDRARKQCGISASPNNQGRGPRVDLTVEQRTCLENKIGKPGEGARPTEDDFKQAHEECGIILTERVDE